MTGCWAMMTHTPIPDQTGNQSVMTMGKVNILVAIWGDFPYCLSFYNDTDKGGVYSSVFKFGAE
jgi:hypothetical protein